MDKLNNKESLNSFKKITKSININDYEVETPQGWVDIKALHETIPYEVYAIKLSNGYSLKCADNHIVINEFDEEIFAKNLCCGDRIITDLGLSEVISIEELGYSEIMYDLELDETSDRVYYTNGILSHNTHLSKMLAQKVFGGIDSLIKLDMSEYSEKFNVSKLIGSPPGYVGYEEGGQLTEKVKNKPYSLILFDEIEKAHPDVFDLLLQLLDEGCLTDSIGRKINFKNTIIIMTSNIGIKEAKSFGNGIGFTNNPKGIDNSENIIKKELQKKFRPEFLNRLDEIVHFNTLDDKDDILRIVELQLDELSERLLESNYNLTVDDNTKKYIADHGYNTEYGVRELQRTIQKFLEDPIADQILKHNLPLNANINVKYDNKSEKPEITIS